MVKSGNMVRQVRKEFEVRTAINFVWLCRTLERWERNNGGNGTGALQPAINFGWTIEQSCWSDIKVQLCPQFVPQFYMFSDQDFVLVYWIPKILLPSASRPAISKNLSTNTGRYLGQSPLRRPSAIHVCSVIVNMDLSKIPPTPTSKWQSQKRKVITNYQIWHQFSQHFMVPIPSMVQIISTCMLSYWWWLHYPMSFPIISPWFSKHKNTLCSPRFFGLQKARSQGDLLLRRTAHCGGRRRDCGFQLREYSNPQKGRK
jgi:hypothetical protein